MCGIFAVCNYQGDVDAYRQRALYLSRKYERKAHLPDKYIFDASCRKLIEFDIVAPTGLVVTLLKTISFVMNV